MSSARQEKPEMRNPEAGKIAAVTGAASGIGQATCRRLLEAGWTVFGVDVAEHSLENVRDGFAGFQSRFQPVVCDVAGAASVSAAFGRIGDHLGALICCAGMLRTGLMETMPIEAFDIVLNPNLRGRFLRAQKSPPSGVSPVGRIAQPDDVMMFLLSDAARYVTRTIIPVDGGTQAAFIPSGSP
jgi:NAD(P)-dependent dehydrogenase (short-subunit alcohol dehydrogenase family)